MATCSMENCWVWGSLPEPPYRPPTGSAVMIVQFKGLTLSPNPDISGPGVRRLLVTAFIPAHPNQVLINFLATAYLTLTLVVLHYLFGFDLGDMSNPIDLAILRFVWRRRGSRPASRWRLPVERAILMFSDQQLVTGIAILAGGYSQLRCSLSRHHWQIILCLAWFSSVTHLATLSALRKYFRNNPSLRYWRVFFMLTMAVMFSVALKPTGSSLWYVTPLGTGIHCFYNTALIPFETRYFPQPILTTPSLPMIFSIAFLSISYFANCIKLFPKSSNFTRRCLRVIPGNLLKTSLDAIFHHSQLPESWYLWTAGHEILLAVLVVFRACFDIFESMVWEIIGLVVALLFGTQRLFATRASAYYAPNMNSSDFDSQENSWTYGQWVPTLLIALPILSIGEMLHETYTDLKKSPSLDIPTNEHRSQSDSHSGGSSDNSHSNGKPAITHHYSRRLVDEEQNNVESFVLRPVISTSTELRQVEERIGTHKPYNRDFYQLEWFRGLVSFIVLAATLLACWVPYASTRYWNFWKAVSYGKYVLAAAFLAVAIYSITCVVVQDFQEPIEYFVEKHFKFGRGFQRKFVCYFRIFFFLGMIVCMVTPFWLFPYLEMAAMEAMIRSGNRGT